MAIYKPYPKYKNSNIPWLGEIPEHWEVMRAKTIGWFNGSTVDKKIIEGESLVRIVNFTDVFNNKSLEIHNKNFMKVSAKPSQIVSFNLKIGDVLFTPSSEDRFDIGRSNVVKYSDVSLLYSYHLIRLRFLKDIDINFKKYLFNNKFIFQYFSSECTGTTRQILVRDKFKNTPIILPPFEEQTSIARFLDYKLAKINRFIRKKKQLITLLNEQKAAIINQAVTKGLDPNVKMKDSGIEWLGEIPEHWEVRKLKYVAKVNTGKTPKIESSLVDFFENGTVDWFTPGDFGNEGILSDSNRKINELAINDSQISLYPEKTVFMVGIGGTIGKIGICFDESSCNQQINALIFNNLIEPLYAYYFLKTQKHQIDLLADFTTLPILNQSKTKDIIFVYPKKDEQQQIVSYIEKETEIINTTISTIEKEIALVEEYKTALIAEAVTGKIDVRGYEVPEISEEETYEDLEEEISMAAEDAADYENESEEL